MGRFFESEDRRQRVGSWGTPTLWWSGQAGERFWLEATKRCDVGTDLRAPLHDDSGQPNWRAISDWVGGLPSRVSFLRMAAITSDPDATPPPSGAWRAVPASLALIARIGRHRPSPDRDSRERTSDQAGRRPARAGPQPARPDLSRPLPRPRVLAPLRGATGRSLGDRQDPPRPWSARGPLRRPDAVRLREPVRPD